MVKRLIVFGDGEKKGLVRMLMLIHFNEFNRSPKLIKSYFDFYRNNTNCKITLNYENDTFSYNGNINEKNILSFQLDYENDTSRKLKIIKNERIKLFDYLSKFL